MKYFNGQGVPQDYKEAASWYRKAAESGNAEAQNNLGLLYTTGQGVPYNLVQAYKWLNLAAGAGNQSAMENKEYLKSP